MSKFIALKKCTLKDIFPFVLIILYSTRPFIMRQHKKSTSISLSKDLLISIGIFAKIISGLTSFFICIFNKSSNSFTLSPKMPLYKAIIILTIISLVDYFGIMFHYFQYSFKNFKKMYDLVGLISSNSLIVFTMILSAFVLKSIIGKHHKLATIIIIIGVVIYTIILIILFNISSSEESLFLTGLLAFVCAFLLTLSISFIEVSEKWLMQFKFMNPFHILLIEGCIQFIFMGITNLILPQQLFSFVTIIETLQKLFTSEKNLTFFFMYVINKILCEAVRIETNNYFSPAYRTIADTLHLFVILYISDNYFLEQLTTIKRNIFKAGCYVTFIFSLIGTLIYNETIILFFNGYETDTSSSIDNRSFVESEDFVNEMKDFKTDKKRKDYIIDFLGRPSCE